MKPWWIALASLTLLAGCAGGGGGSRPDAAGAAPASGGGGGGRYAMQSDAYPEQPPNVDQVPDAVPRLEPRSSGGNRSTYEVWGKTYHVLDDPRGYQKQGTASWYGEKFHGYATASGEIYDMYEMTAAHKSLPLPTYARVTNLDNGRAAIVKVNDRGPFHDDREIDLSYAAAARLDILGNGTGRVRVEAIDPVAWQARQGNGRSTGTGATAAGASSTPTPVAAAAAATVGKTVAPVAAAVPPSAPTPAGRVADPVYLQVAALGSVANAQALKTRLQAELDQPVRVTSDSRLHRVQVGPVARGGELDPLREELRRAGFAQTLVITDD